MEILAIIGGLRTNEVQTVEAQRSMDTAVSILQTPDSFWIIILVGISLAPWLVRRPAASMMRLRLMIYGAAALFFLSALLLFLHLRQEFLSIFADLFPSPEWLLVFPFQLGASPIGATLLVLAWYYVHPMAWLAPNEGGKRVVILKSFAPMFLAIVVLGLMMTISVFIRFV